MLSFECDYNTGAHPKILEALVWSLKKRSK